MVNDYGIVAISKKGKTMSPDQKNTPPETTVPTTPSPTRTTETPANTLLTSPASGMPKSSGSKKIIIIGIVVFLFLIAIVGALILLTNKDKSTNSSQSTATTPSTETTKTSASVLESIRTGLAELNPTETSMSADGNGTYNETSSDKSLIGVPSDLYSNFARQDATLIFSSITDVLKANGLTADKSKGEDNYSSDLVRCTAFANIYYGRVECVSPSQFKAYADQVPAINKAVENKLGFKTEAPFSVYFFEQSDGGKLVGARYATKKVGEDFFFPEVYLTSSDTKTWKYIAQGRKGAQAELAPDCTLFTKEEALLFEGARGGC